MILKTFCVAAIFLLFAQAQDLNLASNLNYLKNVIEKGKERLGEAEGEILGARKNFEKMTEERLHCLNGEYCIQRNGMNETSWEAVARGMFKGKAFASFQCVANAGREAFDKLDAVFAQIPDTTEKLVQKNLALVYPLRFILSGLSVYSQELYQKKREELMQIQDDAAAKKILAEVEAKMKLLEDVAEQIKSKVNAARFAFFEEFVTFVHSTEGSMRRIQREGNQKMLKCVS